MNDLELFLIRKEFLKFNESYSSNKKSNVVQFIFDNDLKQKLTLDEASFVVEEHPCFLLYLFSRITSSYAAQKYIDNYPEVKNKILQEIDGLEIYFE